MKKKDLIFGGVFQERFFEYTNRNITIKQDYCESLFNVLGQTLENEGDKCYITLFLHDFNQTPLNAYFRKKNGSVLLVVNSVQKVNQMHEVVEPGDKFGLFSTDQDKTFLLEFGDPTTEYKVENVISTLEGRVKELRILSRERNKKVRDAFIKEHGCVCDVCGIEMEKVYGDLGRGFIEVHHVVPISETDGEYEIKSENLAALCPNCHAMIHRHKKCILTVEQLRDLYNEHNHK